MFTNAFQPVMEMFQNENLWLMVYQKKTFSVILRVGNLEFIYMYRYVCRVLVFLCVCECLRVRACACVHACTDFDW